MKLHRVVRQFSGGHQQRGRPIPNNSLCQEGWQRAGLAGSTAGRSPQNAGLQRHAGLSGSMSPWSSVVNSLSLFCFLPARQNKMLGKLHKFLGADILIQSTDIGSQLETIGMVDEGRTAPDSARASLSRTRPANV